VISRAQEWVTRDAALRDRHQEAERELLDNPPLEIRTTPSEVFGKSVSAVMARVVEGSNRDARCLVGVGGSLATISQEDAIRLADWLYETYGAGRLPDQAHWLDCAHWVSGRCSCRAIHGEPQ
jgi:hypothetical protein